MKKEYKDLKESIIPGQISLWDIVIKIAEKEAKQKAISEGECSDEQKETVKGYMDDPNLERVILQGGGVGIEFRQGVDEYKTIYINKRGKKEFVIKKRSAVLPMDKILYSSISEITYTELQLEKLKERVDILQDLQYTIIKRKGDLNIYVEYSDITESILPNGKVLEFKNIKKVECEEEEKITNN